MRIGTRGSALALWQAQTVARLIEEAGGPRCEIVVIRTSGDERAGPPDPPPNIAGTSDVFGTPATPGNPNVKRMFVKEIEDALVDGRIDAAVHSSKDLPAVLPAGLRIGAALEREDPRDALILPAATPARDLETAKKLLGTRPRIGTSSVRRAAELRAVFPDASFSPTRGNVETRLRKLDAAECDALVLAAAGLKRLDLGSRITAFLPVDVCVPAPGQGIVAVEVSDGSPLDIRSAVARISDPDAAAALLAERAVVEALGASCQMPLGALATLDGHDLVIHGLVASLDGRRVLRATVRGYRGGAAAAGEKLAARLLAKGAGRLLADAAIADHV